MSAAYEDRLRRIRLESSDKTQEMQLLQEEETDIRNILNGIEARRRLLQTELHKLEREARSLYCDLTYMKAPQHVKNKDDPHDIYKQCLRLCDVTRVHHLDIRNLKITTTCQTSGFKEFVFNDYDMEKINKILRISIEDLEKLASNIMLKLEPSRSGRKFTLKDLRMHTTGDISYVTYTGYSYIVNMLRLLRDHHCANCYGILHDFHSCERTFTKYPMRK
jgi:hypothetical protein